MAMPRDEKIDSHRLGSHFICLIGAIKTIGQIKGLAYCGISGASARPVNSEARIQL